MSAAGAGKEELPTSLWMVPYADLMSNMVILFLALFAYSYGNRSPEYEQALRKMESELATEQRSDETARRLREAEAAVEVRRILDGLALEEFGVRVTSRFVHLTLPSPVLFREGSDRLSPEAERVLRPLAGWLASLPNPVLVSGHTDNLPIVGGRHGTNWELSAARAFSVIDFFVRAGLPPARFRARGYGEFRPVAGNGSEEERRRNRRIELSVVREARG